MNDDTQLQRLTPKTLSQRFGATERWWQRYLPHLKKKGIVSKKGKLFFGSYQTITKWLASNDTTKIP